MTAKIANINFKTQNTESSLGDLDQHSGRQDISPISFVNPKFKKQAFGDSDDSNNELNDTCATLDSRSKTPVAGKRTPAKSVGDVNHLTEVNKRLIAQVSALKQLGPAAQRIKDLEDQIEILLSDNKNLSEGLATQKSDNEALRKNLDSAQNGNKDLNDKNQQLTNIIKDLEAQIKKLNDEKRQKSIEIELFQKKVKAQEAKLKQEIDELHGHKKAREFEIVQLGE